MRNNKRYSNATFTKRVDHEAGRHHTRRAVKEPAVCASCGAVYANRRRNWAHVDAAKKIAYRSASSESVVKSVGQSMRSNLVMTDSSLCFVPFA